MIYSTNSCTSFTGWVCVEWTNVQSMEAQDVKDMWVEIGWVVSVFVIALMFVMFLVQYLLYVIMPKRWSRSMR